MDVQVGSVVTYVDSMRVPCHALVQRVWPREGGKPSLNVVFVSGDANRSDSYGRQVEHATSVPHKDDQAAPGGYWFE